MTRPSADTVADLLQRIKAAWDAGDAVAYAREFTDDATSVIFRGDVLRGRTEIERAHAAVFGSLRGGRMIVEPVVTTMLDDQVASVLTVGGIGDEPLGYDKFQTLTLVRREGRWQCAALQNTAMSERSKQAYET